MRSICTILALTMAVGCSGDDGKDGAVGAPGAAGPAGMNGKNGADGDDGTNGTNGTNGADGDDGVPGAKGEPGDDGADGSAILKGAGAPAAGLGVDGDLYIDTVSRDVYQKADGVWSIITNLSGGPAGPKGDPGTPGADGDDGASVRSGSGVPAAGLGNVGDVYIDSATGDLYAKGAGGWTMTGSIKGPAGADGAGVTLRGADWFAFALTAAFADAPQLITSEAYTETSSSATFTFTGASQHGRLAFQTAGSYLPGGVNLSSFEALSLSASVTGGAATKLIVSLTDGAKKGCQWDLAIAAGPVYSVDLSSPTSCFNTSLGDPDFTLESVTQIQIGVQSSAAGARTLAIDDIDFVDSL